MPSSVRVTATGSANLDGTYDVDWVADLEIDMPKEIFVFKFSTKAFDHVANAGDLVFPTAPDVTQGFYRQDTANETFADISSAEAARTNVGLAVQSLVDDHNSGLATLLTPVITTYS